MDKISIDEIEELYKSCGVNVDEVNEVNNTLNDRQINNTLNTGDLHKNIKLILSTPTLDKNDVCEIISQIKKGKNVYTMDRNNKIVNILNTVRKNNNNQ